jgi:thioredoxin reductase
MTEHGHIKIDHYHNTTVPGVFACGDSTSMMRAVASAVSTGNMTGAIVNKELVEAQF